MLVALWSLTHRYQGISRDGKLYGIQALARLHPALGTDLYLQYTSQDRYTIFSSIYASLVGSLGLQHAALLLFLACTVWFLGAAWVLARELSPPATAWLAVAMLIITVGYYGAYGIFHYSEDYLTARSPAEALVVTSIACHFRGWRRVGLLIAIGALFIHPLMAFPGVFLLVCLRLSVRHAVIVSVAGSLATLSIATAALIAPSSMHLLTIMDASWLEVVRERSQFLFLKYWTAPDWERSARPFVCLTMTALAVHDERIRKLCIGAMLVGASGLAVAFIASVVGPLAVLLQGQAWRWVWITSFVSVLLLVPTVLQVARDEKCGLFCAMLLILGWTCTAIDGLACTEAALILWMMRSRIGTREARYLRWAAGAVGVAILAWVSVKSWAYASLSVRTGHDHSPVPFIRDACGLGVSTVLPVWFFWRWIKCNRAALTATLVCAALFASLVFILPGSFSQPGTAATAAEFTEFSDWRDAIPPTSNVLVLPTAKSAPFSWFALERPSYLSVDQSSGVVFSRATALEVRRRSEVLQPATSPDWRILTRLTEARTAKRNVDTALRPLTAKSLISICKDPQLDFVIAKEDVGLDPIRHTHTGAWKDWNLYDCRRVRSLSPTARDFRPEKRPLRSIEEMVSTQSHIPVVPQDIM
jgi:hypothetical protein